MYCGSFAHPHPQIYGRYIDDAFMTTNLSEEQINIQLDKAKIKDPNIEITYKIGTSIDFLDVAVSNDQGQLTTSIFHKSAAEPYILPYTSDHPRHLHRNIPFASLLRVARICSNVHDLDLERVRTDMSLLLNGYPPNFINEQFLRFFQLNSTMPVLTQLDPKVYHALHTKLLHQPTRREKQLQNMMTAIEQEQLPEALQNNKPWNPNVIYARHQFESGPKQAFKGEFRAWWKQYYVKQGSKVAHVKIKLATKTNPTLAHVFVHKKPQKELLTKLDNSA